MNLYMKVSPKHQRGQPGRFLDLINRTLLLKGLPQSLQLFQATAIYCTFLALLPPAHMFFLGPYNCIITSYV